MLVETYTLIHHGLTVYLDVLHIYNTIEADIKTLSLCSTLYNGGREPIEVWISIREHALPMREHAIVELANAWAYCSNAGSRNRIIACSAQHYYDCVLTHYYCYVAYLASIKSWACITLDGQLCRRSINIDPFDLGEGTSLIHTHTYTFIITQLIQTNA